MSEEDRSEYIIDRPICCSVNTFLCANYIWGLLSLGLLAVGIVGVAVQGGVLILLPPQAYATALAFGGYSLIVILAGVTGQKMRVELLFLLYVLLMALGLIAQTLAFCFLMLYANDVSTISTFDDAAIDAQRTLEKHLVDFAANEPEGWEQTQNKLECCGIDFEAGLEDDFDIDEVESGDRCEEGDEITADLRVEADGADVNDLNFFDEFGNFISARDDVTIGFEAEYFCKAKISSLVKQYTPAIAASLAVLLFVQLVALVSASRMYWVPEFLGGWQFDDDEMEVVAKRKGIAMPTKNEYTGGNRVLSTLREKGNRLSFRLKNAYTADPEVPASAGFLNRLSLNRNAISGHGSFIGRGGENAAPEKLDLSDVQDPYARQAGNMGSRRNMFNRISQRLNLKSMGGHSLIDVNPNVRDSGISGTSNGEYRPSQPAGPPPGFQSNSNPSRAGRMSQRLQQGFQSVGSAFSSRGGFFINTPKPAPPPGPPMQQMSTSTQSMMNGAPPPNTFQRGQSNPNLALSPPGLGMPPVPTPRMSPAPAYQPPAQNAAPAYQSPAMQQSAPAPYKPPTQVAPAPAPYKPPTQVASTPAAYKPPTQVPPRQTNGKKKSSAPAPAPSSGGGGGGGLLAQIRQGQELKKAKTVDKSAPRI